MRTAVAAAAVSLVLVLAAGPASAQVPPPYPPPGSGVTVPTVDLASAQTVFYAWLGAQNAGDWETYQSLYASNFMGVRRNGPKTIEFDRAGWLKDRSRMFRKKMRVTADEVKFHNEGPAGVITFVQTWASGSYEDRGGKRLVLIWEGGAVRIAREQMVSSEVLKKSFKVDPRAFSSRAFAYVVSDPRGGDFAMLDRGSAMACAGPARLLGRGVAVTCRPADASTEVRRWVDREVRVYTDSGAECRATVGRPKLLLSYTPHFGQTNRWEGVGDFQGDPRVPDAAVVQEATASIPGDDVFTTASLTYKTGRCGDPLWIRDAGLPAPKLFVPAWGADPATAERALTYLRSLPAWGGLQREYQAIGYEGIWDQNGAHAQQTIRVMARPGGGGWVYAGVRGGEQCSDFYGELWGIWEMTASGSLRLVVDGSNHGEFAPAAALDIDGDGVPEFLSRKRLFRLIDGVWQSLQRFEPNDYDCPC